MKPGGFPTWEINEDIFMSSDASEKKVILC